jgi:hypothetical protein
MSNSVFEQLLVDTVSNLACFGSINIEAVGLHHVSLLGHQAALGQPAHEQPLVNKIKWFAGQHHESR